MLNQKSVLARLLAKENINVTQGNYPTAFFDVKKRELGLPNWKEMSKDIYDLLVGHEVGHALETPTNFVEIIGEASIPHGYLNVVEDIRIEKKMLAKYPGLVGNFKRGYKELMYDRNLFEIANKDISLLPFMDRLNLKAKGRDLIDVPFTEEEMPYFLKAMSVETFEDVIAVCKEILAWLKAKKEKQNESSVSETNEAPSSSDNKDDNDGEDEGDESEDETETTESSSGDADEGDKSEDETETSESSSGSAEDTSSSTPKENDVTDEELEEVATDAAFERNQGSLVEGTDTVFLNGMSRVQYEMLKTNYPELNMARDLRISHHVTSSAKNFVAISWKKYQAESKSLVNAMVKEFEMRKAAYRSLRATVSTKGTIDVNKLHSYRYNDQMFKQLSNMADAKSHGMIMLIDYSGSMYNVLPAVIRQTLTLVSFCKRVNIPFQVFAFTSKTATHDKTFGVNFAKTMNGKSGYDIVNLQLLELLNSKMSKSVYTKTLEQIFWRSECSWAHAPQEELGNTPLNAALMAMHFAIADFRKSHNVQKMNLVVLTDGESNQPSIHYGDDGSAVSRSSKKKIAIADKIVELGMDRGDTQKLVKSITDMDVKTINYRLMDRRDEMHVLLEAFDWKVDRYGLEINSAKNNLKKDGIAVFDDNNGYSRRFIVSSKTLNSSASELEVSDTANVKQAAKALTKFGNAKQKTRLLSQKFADIIS